MQIVKSRVYRVGYRVEPWDMERLVQNLGGDENVSRISVELGDGSSITVPHVGELSAIPNLPTRPITGICVESAPPPFLATEQSPARLAIVQFRDRGSFGLSYHVSGDERAVRDLTEKLEDWVDSVTPWFGRLAFMDSPGLLFRGMLVVLRLRRDSCSGFHRSCRKSCLLALAFRRLSPSERAFWRSGASHCWRSGLSG